MQNSLKSMITGQVRNRLTPMIGGEGRGVQRYETSGNVNSGTNVNNNNNNISSSDNNLASANFGGFDESQYNSSSIAASKVAKELADTNEVSVATTNQHGVKLITRPTTSIANRLGYESNHKISDSSIRESTWNLSAMTARPALVHTIAWDNDTSVVSYFDIPSSFLVSSFMSMPFHSFTYFRGDVVLQFQVNASPLYQGCLMVSYIPLMSTDITLPTAKCDIRSWLSMNQSMYIYANTNTVAEMRIPFFHYKSYLQNLTTVLESGNSMGLLAFYVLNPLKSNAELPSANVSVYMHLENAEFKVPRINNVIPNTVTRRRLRPQGNTTSNITQVWDHVQGSAMTTKTEGDKLDMKAQVEMPSEAMAALDNPTFPVMLPNLTIKGIGHASSALGCEYVERMALYPNALSTCNDETFGTSIDEMVIANIKQRYTYITSFDIVPSSQAGTKLFTLPLSPVMGTFSKSDGTYYPPGTLVQGATNPMYMPLISYISLPFTTWTGGITYKFQFVASAVHTCKIFVGLHYGVYDPTKIVDDVDLTGQYGVAYEINQGSNELEVTAPYISTVPYLFVPRGGDPYAESMGTLSISIINPLVSPSSVNPNITVNVFVAGASDYQVNGMHPTLPFVVGSPVVTTLRAQSSVAPTNIAPTITSIAQDDLVGPDQVGENHRQKHLSRDVSSIRDVLRKYQFVTKRSINPGNVNTSASISVVPVQKTFLRIDPWYLLGVSPALNQAEFESSNFLPDIGAFSWFSTMYGLFRGSLRFKIIVRPIMNQFSTFQQPCPPVSWRVLFSPPTTCPRYTGGVIKDCCVGGQYATSGKGIVNASWVDEYTKNILPFAKEVSQPLLSMVASPSIAAEFEVPYMSIFHSVPIKQLSNAETSVQIASETGGLGSLYVMLDFLTDLNYPNNGNAFPFSGANVEIYVAFGDETRLGNLNYLPMIKTNPMISVADGEFYASSYGMDFGVYPTPPPSELLSSPINPNVSDPLFISNDKLKDKDKDKEEIVRTPKSFLKRFT